MNFVRILLTALLMVGAWSFDPASNAFGSSQEPTTAEIHAAAPGEALNQDSGREKIDRAWHGYYTQERSAVHETIIGALVAKGRTAPHPRIVFTSGPYAAGKTTLLRQLHAHGFIDLNDYVVIDMDQIRERLPEFAQFNRMNRQTATERTQKESGYITELAIWRAVAQRKNILIDGSLSNFNFWTSLMERIAAETPIYRGRFDLIQVTSQLSTLLERVEQRNMREARFTPPDQVSASYFRSVQAYKVMSGLMDSIVEFDTTFRDPRLISLKTAERDGRHEIPGVSLPLSKIRHLAQAGVEQASSRNSLAVTLLPSALKRPANNGYRVVIDLDWTMIYGIKDPDLVPANELIRYEGTSGTEYFRFSDSAAELIENLLKLPGMKVSFFSGGDKKRNEFVLKALKLSDGRSAFEVAEHVFSNPDLTPISDDPSLKFVDRFKKRLQGLIPDLDLTRTLLVDDQPEFASKGLRAIHAHGEFNFRQEFDPSRVGESYEARTEELFRLERAKLAMIFAVIERSHQADRQGLAEFSRAAESLLKDPLTGKWLQLESPRLRPLFKRGLKALAGSKHAALCSAAFGSR